MARSTPSAANPPVLHVPPGHATGSVNLNPEAILTTMIKRTIEKQKTESRELK